MSFHRQKIASQQPNLQSEEIEWELEKMTMSAIAALDSKLQNFKPDSTDVSQDNAQEVYKFAVFLIISFSCCR